MPQPKPLKHGRDGRCEICGARGPLTEISLPKKRRPVMVCIRCYRNIQMRNLYSNKDFDEDDDFQDKWMAENHSFENAVTNMLAVANHLGSVEAAREQWGAAPQVWEEVTRRFNDSFNSSNYTLGPNCKCSATLQWSDKKRAWYCVECPFNTFKDAESFEAEEPFKADRKLLKELGERFHRRFCSIIRCGPKCSLRFRESKPIPGQYVYVNTRFNQPKLEPIRTTEYDEVYYNFSPETKKKLKDWAEEQSKELGRTVKLSWNYCEGDYRSGKDIQISLPKEREKNAESKKLQPVEKMGQAIVDDFCDNFNIRYWTEKGRGRDYGFASLDLWMDMDVPPPYYYTELEGQRLDEMEWLYKGTGSWGKEKYKPNNRYKEWVKKIKKKYPMFSKMKFIPSYGSANPDTCDGPQNIDAYVLFDSPDLMAAESKKLPPIEKAEITGIASGATMEGLDLALAGEMFECQDCDERCHICGTGQLHEHIIDCEVCKEPFCRKRCWGCWECEAICERCEGQCPTHINPNEIMEYDRENPIPDKPYSRTHKIGTMPWQKDTGCITYWEDGEVCRYCENDDWTKANKDYEQYWTWKNANRKREQFIRKAEGLETLLAAETLTGYRSKTDKRQMLDELAHSIYKKELTSEKVFPGIRVSSKVVLYPDGDTKKERDLSRFQMSMKYSDRMVHQCDNCGIWASSKQTNSWEKDKSREGKKNEIVYYQKDVVNPSEYFGYCVKCYDNLSEKGQLGSNPFSAEEEQSVYYWVKTEMENRHPLSQSDLEQLLDMISFNVPLSNIEFGIAQAEEMGDEPTYIILELAHKKAKFIKKYQAEEEEEDDEDDGYWNEGEAPWRESASKYDEFDESNPFSLSNLLWLNNHGGVPKLNDGEHYVLKKLKSLLYNWDGEPEYSDVFQEDLQKACGDYPSSLKRTLNSLSKKGLIDVQNVPTGEYKQTTWKFTRDKDGNLIPITKPLIYPKPLMVLYAINMGWGNPEWLQYALDDSKKQTIFHTEEYKVADEDWAGQSCEDCYEEIKVGDSVHDDGYVLICKKCYSNYKIPCEHEACGERFKNKEEEEEHRQETCHNCDGEGWIVTHYTPATYHDPADIDGEDCEECGGEGWVCDEFNAESFSADEQKACHRCGNTEKDGKLWWVGSRKGFICSDCSDGGKKYRAESFSAESNGDITIRQQAIDTIEARVADYTTHEDVSPYWGGGIVNPNKYLYFKLRYAWNNHPEQREEIIQQYMRGIKEGEIDPSNPLPHGAPNQHLPSQWDAESFSAESNGDLQLDESKKRTKMSAIRTGLAITTFGIVMWNLWTNKKQEKDIADIMDLV